jgi:hypothetical protein
MFPGGSQGKLLNSPLAIDAIDGRWTYHSPMEKRRSVVIGRVCSLTRLGSFKGNVDVAEATARCVP